MKKLTIILLSVLFLSSCGIKKELIKVKEENEKLKTELVEKNKEISRKNKILDENVIKINKLNNQLEK